MPKLAVGVRPWSALHDEPCRAIEDARLEDHQTEPERPLHEVIARQDVRVELLARQHVQIEFAW